MTSCKTHMWNCQMSRVLHLAKVKSIFLSKAVSVTWLQQPGCLSIGMLCVAVNFEAGIRIRNSAKAWSTICGFTLLWAMGLNWDFKLQLLSRAIKWEMLGVRLLKGWEIVFLMNEDLYSHLINSIHLLLDLLYHIHKLLLLIKLKKFCYNKDIVECVKRYQLLKKTEISLSKKC